MEPVPVQKSRRGRKRQSDEELLSEAERTKKEKNRMAAQKCREKKEKEAKELKTRNEELERENKKLSDEKKKLQERAQEFHKIIKDHVEKGCRLPPDVEELFLEDKDMISSNGDSDDLETFRAVGMIERDHTPPHTPESMSSDKMSPKLQYHFHNFSGNKTGAPTALFSGTLLSDHGMTRVRSSSTSRSSSPSPSLPLSPAKTVSPGTGKLASFTMCSKSNTVPITIRQDTEYDDKAQFSHHSGQILPTVVSEMDDETEEAVEFISKSSEIIDRGQKITGINVQLFESDMIKLAMENSLQTEESCQNLSSLGFNYASDYSYTKDLQQMESVQEIIEYTNGENHSGNQNSKMKNFIGSFSGHSESEPVVNVKTCAPALLEIGSEMSESLQKQIQTSYNNSSINHVPGTISVTGVNLQNVARQQQPAELVEVNQNTGSSQQRMFVLKEQKCSADEGQAVRNNLESSKKEQIHTSLSPNILFKIGSDGQILFVGKSDLVSHFSTIAQNKLASQSQEDLNSVQNHEAHQLKIQSVGKILQHGLQPRRVSLLPQQLPQSSSASSSSKEFSFQQVKQKQMTSGYVVGNVGPAQVKLPKNNSTPVSIQELSYPVPKTTSFQPSSYASLVRSQDLSGHQQNPPQTHASKLPVSNGHFLNNTQVTDVYSQALSASSVAETFSVGSDSLVNTSETVDYSANVQDLPSLNFLELQLENNLFEKKPSRLTS